MGRFGENGEEDGEMVGKGGKVWEMGAGLC
jgi:hypothetical protein